MSGELTEVEIKNLSEAIGAIEYQSQKLEELRTSLEGDIALSVDKKIKEATNALDNLISAIDGKMSAMQAFNGSIYLKPGDYKELFNKVSIIYDSISSSKKLNSNDNGAGDKTSVSLMRDDISELSKSIEVIERKIEELKNNSFGYDDVAALLSSDGVKGKNNVVIDMKFLKDHKIFIFSLLVIGALSGAALMVLLFAAVA